jgi:hypothetical protein
VTLDAPAGFPSAGAQAGRRQLAGGRLVIPVAGTWTSRIDILVNDFEIVRLQGDIQIRP